MANIHPKKLVFLHIPKTAGSSIGSFFDSQFQEDEVCHIYSGNPNVELEKALIDDRIKFIRGHFGLYKALRPSLNNTDVFIFTFLRDPVNRVISLYNHLKRRQLTEHLDRMNQVTSLQSFLDLKQDFNEQTRYLSGIQGKEKFQKSISDAYAQAINNASKINFIGSVEHLQKDMQLLCKQLDFTLPTSMKAKNKGMKRLKQQLLQLRYQQKIKQVESFDFKLYNQLIEAHID